MVGFRQEGPALIWERQHEIVRIEPWGPNSLRVRASIGPGLKLDLPGALLEPAATPATVQITPAGAVLANGQIAAEVTEGGLIRFIDPATGQGLLAEQPRPTSSAWPPARWYRAVPGELFTIEASFRANPDERLYGLGQQRHGRLDHKGCVIDLLHRNTRVSIPFMLSTQGYGFLWNNPAIGRVELGHNGTRWVAQAAPQLDYWVTAGQTPAQIVEQYADATGHAPALPEFAAGLWQSKLRYASQAELLSVAREHQRRGLPLSVIVIDFFHWTVQGEWEFDPAAWPDPRAMVSELEAMGTKVMVSIWPTVNENSRYYQEMEDRGLLVRNDRGLSVNMNFVDNRPDGPVNLHFFDPFNPEARQFVWEKARDHYYRHGIQVFWLDEAEPEMWPMDPDNLRYHLGSGLAVGNLYPMLYARGFYEGMRAEGQAEIVNLCRCAWAGSQRYGAAVWSGDIDGTFEELRRQVRAGLNMGLSGIPWWTTDIGGFYGGSPDDPAYRELVVRWFQYATFCPLLRMHGFREPKQRLPTHQGGPNEIWSYGDEAYAIMKDFLFRRERLRPYIMDQMRAASARGTPPMRPLFYDFPQDQAAYPAEDEFMFGPDLLVAPLLFPGARIREVYLPAGTDWKDAWTGQTYAGGQVVNAPAPLDKIPLFLRGEADLPIRAGSTAG